MTTCPWNYSDLNSDKPLVLNEPTDLGRALGREVSRLHEVSETEMLANGETPPERCDECAFRAGTDPNGCESTLMDATKCVIEGEPFYCHKGAETDGEPRRLCAGFVVATWRKK